MSTEKARGHVVTFIIALAAGLFSLGVYLGWADALPHTSGTYVLRAVSPTAESLAPGTSVRIAGIQVGTVGAITAAPAGVTLTLDINKRYAPLPSDTRFGIRTRTLVGENYVQLYPGTSKTDLHSGGILPLSQANLSVDADQVLSELRGNTRAEARAMIQGLDRGLQDKGQDLHQLLTGVTGLITSATPVTQVLSASDHQLSELVDNLGRVSAEIGARDDDIRTLAAGANSTFVAISDQDRSVRRIFAELPGTLNEVRIATGTIHATTGTIAPVLTGLATAVHDLHLTVQKLPTVSTEGQMTLTDLQRAVNPLDGVLAHLQTVSRPLSNALPQVKDVLCQLNPAAKYLQPYGPELAALLQDLGSATNYYDAFTHAARLQVTAGENNLGIYSQQVSNLIDQLAGQGIVTKVLGLIRYDPYPAPGHAGETSAGLTATGPGTVTAKYPHITASC